VRWFELPAYMAVDVWREYIRKYTLNELFDPNIGIEKGFVKDDPNGRLHKGETCLEIIKWMVNERFKNPKVDELDDFGKLTGNKIISREYQLVTSMGIQVFRVPISDISFPPSVENKLVHDWMSTWLVRAEKGRSRVEQSRRYSKIKGERQAVKVFADAAIYDLVRAFDTGNR
jgi:hypothetical protein